MARAVAEPEVEVGAAVQVAGPQARRQWYWSSSSAMAAEVVRHPQAGRGVMVSRVGEVAKAGEEMVVAREEM